MRQQEHGVDPQAQGQERDDLGGAGVKGQAQEGAEAQASGYCDCHQEDPAEAEGSLRPDNVGPTEESKSGINQLEKKSWFLAKNLLLSLSN